MTLNQFLADLRRVRGFFISQHGGRIRRRRLVGRTSLDPLECPITAVANRRYRRFQFPREDEYGSAAVYLGLSSKLADRIADASDGPNHGQPALRSRLRKVLGL